MMRKTCYFMIFIGLICGLTDVRSQVVPTNEWVNFYGTNTILDGAPVPVGAVIKAYDPDSVLCGMFTVTTAGQYGFMPVYRDDALTPGVDEGANPGNEITFTINDHPAVSTGPGDPIWTVHGARINLNLEASSNLPPVVIKQLLDINVDEDAPDFVIADLDTVFSDPNSDPLVFTALSSELAVAVNIDSENLAKVSLLENWHGTASIILTADDGKATVQDTILINVLSRNDSPKIEAIDDTTAYEDSEFSMQVVATDVDSGQILVFSDDSPLFEINPESGLINFTPVNADVGSYLITISVSDGITTETEDFTLTVKNVNDAPVVTLPAEIHFGEDNSAELPLTPLVTDVDDDPVSITWEATSSPNIIVLINPDKQLALFAATKNWSGSEQVIFKASDAAGASDSDTLMVQVFPLNDPPVISPNLPDISFANDTTATLDLSPYAEDVDSKVLNWTAQVETGKENSIAVEINKDNKIATFSASSDFEGEVNVVFTVSDDSSATASDTILVKVTKPTVVDVDQLRERPGKCELSQNYPNPFNPVTEINYQIDKNSNVFIEVYNLLGEKIITLINENQKAGYYSVGWNGRNEKGQVVPSGVYLYRIQAGDFISIKRMMLLK